MNTGYFVLIGADDGTQSWANVTIGKQYYLFEDETSGLFFTDNNGNMVNADFYVFRRPLIAAGLQVLKHRGPTANSKYVKKGHDYHLHFTSEKTPWFYSDTGEALKVYDFQWQEPVLVKQPVAQVTGPAKATGEDLLIPAEIDLNKHFADNGEPGVMFVLEPLPELPDAVVEEELNPKAAYGSAKAPMDSASNLAIISMQNVMEGGCHKYGYMNYRESKINARTYINALKRHLMIYEDGVDVDGESNQLHMGHVMACAAILIDAGATGQLVDDRSKTGLVEAALLKSATDAQTFRDTVKTCV